MQALAAALFGMGLRQRTALVAITALAGGALSFAPSAARADLVCQAALNNASTCPRAAFLGETVVVDFAAVMAANPNLFTNNSIAWERGNQILINTTSNGPLNLSNVRLLASGTSFDSSGNQLGAFTDQLLTVWSSPPNPNIGVSNYTPVSPNGSNYRQASFTLSPTGIIGGRGVAYNTFTSLKLLLENATLAAAYPSLNISLKNYDAGNGVNDPNALVFGTNATLGVPAPLPLMGGAFAFGWSRRLRRRLQASKSLV